MSKENAKKENIVSTPVVATNTKTTFEAPHALVQTKDNVKVMTVSQVIDLAHAINFMKLKDERINDEAYSDNEAKASKLMLRLGKKTDLGKLNYADLASLCRLINLSTSVTVYESKKEELHAEPIFMNCKTTGDLFFKLMKQDINFATVSNIAHDKLLIKSINCSKKASDKNDDDTNELYEAINRDCAVYMKKKGVFNWNMEKVVDNYRLVLLHGLTDTVKDSAGVVKTVADLEK